MKLLLCNECYDVFSLNMTEKSCTCGKSKGKYLDNLYAEYSGPSVPLGFANQSFNWALRNQPEAGNKGYEFTAFVIQKQCPTFKKVDNEEI